MRCSCVILIMFATALSGADIPTWACHQSECNKKTLQFSKNAPLSGVGGTILQYDLKKNTTTDTVSMGAQYSFEQFSAKIQSDYIKNRSENTPPVGKTNLLLQYRQKLWDSLSLNASENVTIPNEQTDLLKYTSILKALYPVNDIYNVFVEGSYTLLDTPASEGTLYRNPYSYTTGINYSDGTDTAINASYMLIQGADPTLGANKKIKLAHKHKINKKMKTSLSVTKSLETEQPDNKALFDVIYAF